MNEEFLHYIWRYALYDSSDLLTTCGKTIQIINPGNYNRDAGPDFLEAKILIGSVLWVGHVEIHVNARDWDYHKHQFDPGYDPVILHVVNTADKKVKNSLGNIVPTVELKINPGFYLRYKELLGELRPIPCGTKWQDLSPVKVENAIVSMGVERMEERMKSLGIRLKENRGGWKELFLQTICRGFGFGKNNHPMEVLGRSINPGWVERHYANLFQLESIFLGQAGMLPDRHQNSYLAALRTEYNYLFKKYNMVQPLGLQWKYLRMRPGNFPSIRLAQLCAFLSKEENLTEKCLDIVSSGKIQELEIQTSSYWRSHYDIDKKSSGLVPSIGTNSKLLLMINVFLPLNGFFKQRNGSSAAIELWLEQLENLPAEDNRVIRQWESIGFRVPNAFYSQSFLFIYRNYCIEKKCLTCRIGQLILGKEKVGP